MHEWKKTVDSRGGKSRSKPYGTPTRDNNIEKALCYFVRPVIFLTE